MGHICQPDPWVNFVLESLVTVTRSQLLANGHIPSTLNTWIENLPEFRADCSWPQIFPTFISNITMPSSLLHLDPHPDLTSTLKPHLEPNSSRVESEVGLSLVSISELAQSTQQQVVLVQSVVGRVHQVDVHTAAVSLVHAVRHQAVWNNNRSSSFIYLFIKVANDIELRDQLLLQKSSITYSVSEYNCMKMLNVFSLER